MMSENEKPSAPAASGLETLEGKYEEVEGTGVKEQQAEEKEQLSSGEHDETSNKPENVEQVLRKYFFTSGKRLPFHPFFDKQDEIEYAGEPLKVEDTPEPKTLTEVQFKMIATESDLKQMVARLDSATEISVSLKLDGDAFETSVNGLVICSDEVSCSIDVDTLDGHLDLLAPIFLDPKVTKIMNMVPRVLWWLQEKQGVFVANAFDLSVALMLVPNSFKADVKQRVKKFSQDVLKTGLLPPIGGKANKAKSPGRKFNFLLQLHINYLFNVYLYRMLRSTLLAQFGAQGYLKIKRAMDDWCKFQHVSTWKILATQVQHNLRLKQEVQKKLLSELFTWRQNVAIAKNRNLDSVLPVDRLVQLASVMPTDPAIIRAIAESKFVERDMAEVKRILVSNTSFLLSNPSKQAKWLDRQKFAQYAKGGAKRLQSPMESSELSLAKHQKLRQDESWGFVNAPRGASFSASKPFAHTVPKSYPQVPRGSFRGGSNRGVPLIRPSTQMDQGSPWGSIGFSSTPGNFQSQYRNAGRNSWDYNSRSGNFENSSGSFSGGSGASSRGNMGSSGSGGFRNSSGNFRGLDDSRSNPASSREGIRSFSGNFGGVASSPRNVRRNSGGFRPSPDISWDGNEYRNFGIPPRNYGNAARRSGYFEGAFANSSGSGNDQFSRF